MLNILSLIMIIINQKLIFQEDLFIEKDSSINEELERLRLSATASLLSFDDVIVIASVSANYGLGKSRRVQSNGSKGWSWFWIFSKKVLLKLVKWVIKEMISFW